MNDKLPTPDPDFPESGRFENEHQLRDPGRAEDEHRRGKPRRWPWIVGVVAALFVGVGIGSAVQPEPETIVETVIEEVEVEVEPADIADQRREWDRKIGELGVQEADLDDRAADLDAREQELTEREEAVTGTERDIAENTIPGDGVWVVGDEIQPGTYRAQGSGDGCYWARLPDLSGDGILANHFGSANVTVEIRSSDVAFETTRCGSWVKQ